MHFLASLKSGVSIESAASEFVADLLETSWHNNELCIESACDFVEDTLKSIGLTCQITIAEIISGENLNWPMEQLQIYSFNYVEKEFRKVEQFLVQISLMVQEEHSYYLDKQVARQEGDMDDTPVEYLMQLVAIWCNVYKQLQEMEESQEHKRFEEPLARINFHLLLGLHHLRKIYRFDLNLLDAICNRLYLNAVEGLFYKQCHQIIFNGLLKIFSKDYDLFYQYSNESINFFYEAFSVQIRSFTHNKIYAELQKMLTENNTSQEKLNILINFLIEPHMLKVYFNTLITKSGKNSEKFKTRKNIAELQQEALKFLNILQSKLLTIDCFSLDFMESILTLIFKNDDDLSVLACNLYITMMKRKFSESVILKHFMNFCANKLDSIDNLKSCVLKMYKSIGVLLSFNNFLKIIADTSVTLERCLSAHMVVIVFEIKSKEQDTTSKQEVDQLLHILPELFENLQCQITIGILLQVFFYASIEELPQSTIDNFIHFAVGAFSHIEINYEYPLLMNTFKIFHKCIIFNNEFGHLEQFTEHLLSRYRPMINELKKVEETQNEILLKSSLTAYNSLLKRLSIIFKLNYNLADESLSQIIKCIIQYILNNSVVQKVIISEKSLIDVYAVEMCLSCILKLSKIEIEENRNYSCFTEAQELLKYLWQSLKNLDHVLKMPMVRIKSYLSSLIHLFINFPLKLENNVYHHMIQLLININFKTKSFDHNLADELQQVHPMQIIVYQRLIFKDFIELHKSEQVQINTNMAWKLCIYYGMPNHKYNEELAELLKTLANFRLKIYKNLIAILIYNLYNHQPALRYSTIMSIIKKHKHLIDNEIHFESTELIKITIVLLVLQIIEKGLFVQSIKIDSSRLEALRHLNIFMEDLDLDLLQVKNLIEENLENCAKHVLTAEERKILYNFRRDLNGND